MKHLFIFIISCYQAFFPIRGNCRFYPTCSAYTKEAIKTHGLVAGLFMGVKRISKCHPFSSSGVDFVEEGHR